MAKCYVPWTARWPYLWADRLTRPFQGTGPRPGGTAHAACPVAPGRRRRPRAERHRVGGPGLVVRPQTSGHLPARVTLGSRAARRPCPPTKARPPHHVGGGASERLGAQEAAEVRHG